MNGARVPYPSSATSRSNVCLELRPGRDFIGSKELDQINRELIDRITEAKLAEGAGNATVNRHLALVRTRLRVRLLDEPRDTRIAVDVPGTFC